MDQPKSPDERILVGGAIASIEFRLKWLEKEVDILEAKIQFFDDLSFRVKGWAIATWSALITFALTKDDWRVVCVAALVPLLFLVVDASYKRYQACFIDRTRDIMVLLNNREAVSATAQVEAYPFVVYDLLGIHGRGRKEITLDRRWGPIARMAVKASVALVYWVLVLISMVVLVLLSN